MGRRNMKRLIGTLALAAGLASGLVMSAAAANDAKGPPCTNFINGDAVYNSTSGTVSVEMKLDATDCTGEYRLRIYNFTSTGTGKPLVKNIDATGYSADPETGNTIVNFSYTFGSGAAPSDGVCIVVESFHSGHVADRAPDSGCVALDPVSGGASGFH
jgi:hypothetical protein